MSDQGEPGAGWFPDPARRYDFRWFNGREWTGDVSVGGQRYVDPVPAWQVSSRSAPAIGDATAGSPADDGAPRPTQTMAVLALITGVIATATAWMPVVVVLGGTCAVLAVVLGGVARSRIAAGRAAGRGMAIAGLVLGLVGLALVPVGVVLTQRVIDEVLRFAEPGRLDVEITSCAAQEGRVEVAGIVHNLDDATHDYLVFIEVSDIRGRDDRVVAEVDDVEPGARRTWSVSERTRLDGELRCSVDVTGPYPFGIETPPPD